MKQSKFPQSPLIIFSFQLYIAEVGAAMIHSTWDGLDVCFMETMEH